MINIKKAYIKEAVKSLKQHGVVAFPTETVMGLAVVYNDYDAYLKLNKVKERPEDKPYTLMCGDVSWISTYANIDSKMQKIIDCFMPGSITILVPVKDNVPSYVTHGTTTIGLRVPTNIEALAMLKELGLPVLAPSANKSGEKPAINSEEVKQVFGEQLDYIMPGAAYLDKPSTIVNLCGEEPVLVRPGPIDIEDIKKVWNE